MCPRSQGAAAKWAACVTSCSGDPVEHVGGLAAELRAPPSRCWRRRRAAAARASPPSSENSYWPSTRSEAKPSRPPISAASSRPTTAAHGPAAGARAGGARAAPRAGPIRSAIEARLIAAHSRRLTHSAAGIGSLGIEARVAEHRAPPRRLAGGRRGRRPASRRARPRRGRRDPPGRQLPVDERRSPARRCPRPGRRGRSRGAPRSVAPPRPRSGRRGRAALRRAASPTNSTSPPASRTISWAAAASTERHRRAESIASKRPAGDVGERDRDRADGAQPVGLALERLDRGRGSSAGSADSSPTTSSPAPGSRGGDRVAVQRRALAAGRGELLARRRSRGRSRSRRPPSSRPLATAIESEWEGMVRRTFIEPSIGSITTRGARSPRRRGAPRRAPR